MYGCESWTVKKAEYQRIDAFELWCWRRLLRVPWTARRSNQSILKKISPEYSLEGLMLKLKLQYYGHLMWRTDSLGKTLMLGKIEGRRRRGWQRMRWSDDVTDSMDMNLSKLQQLQWTGRPGVLQSTGSHRVEHDWAIELNQTDFFYIYLVFCGLGRLTFILIDFWRLVWIFCVSSHINEGKKSFIFPVCMLFISFSWLILHWLYWI